jgi:hypothetical protein
MIDHKIKINFMFRPLILKSEIICCSGLSQLKTSANFKVGFVPGV